MDRFARFCRFGSVRRLGCAALLGAVLTTPAAAQAPEAAAANGGNGVVYLVVSLVALVIAIVQWYARKRRQHIATWPETSATITRHWIERTVKRNDSDQNGPTEEVSYSPKVEYRYEVGGTTHTCRNVGRWQRSHDFEGDAWADVEEHYPVGLELPVFYDPANPKDAVLHREEGEPGAIGNGFYWGTLGLEIALFVGFGVAAAIAFATR